MMPMNMAGSPLLRVQPSINGLGAIAFSPESALRMLLGKSLNSAWQVPVPVWRDASTIHHLESQRIRC